MSKEELDLNKETDTLLEKGQKTSSDLETMKDSEATVDVEELLKKINDVDLVGSSREEDSVIAEENELPTAKEDIQPEVTPPVTMSRKEMMASAKKNKKNKSKESKAKERQLKKEQKLEKKAAHKKSKKRKVFKWLISLMLLSLLGFVGFAGWSLYSKTDNAISNAFKPRQNQQNNNEHINPITDPISILVLGVDDNDERSIGSARTDAMLLLTVSPKTNKITMTSIPRDTYTQINAPNYNGRGKINSAYAHGGIDATVDAVESLFAEKQFNTTTGTEEIINRFPINYYLTLDFNAFEAIIDALGGIDIEVKLPETVIEQNAKGKKVVKLENGQQVLNGEGALAYARTRKIDNDVMRGSRQQQVMEATISKAMSMGSITKFEKVIDALNGHFWTDMNMSTMKKVAESGLRNKYSFESYIFDWTGFDYNEESMVALHQDSLNHISHKFRLNLGLDEKDPVIDSQDYQFKSNGIISQYTFPLDGQGITN